MQNSAGTVVEWWANCRLVCSGIVQMVPKYGDTSETPKQIHESFFSVRRKYNRGRILASDASKCRLELFKEEFEVSEWGEDEEDVDREMDFGHDEKD